MLNPSPPPASTVRSTPAPTSLSLVTPAAGSAAAADPGAAKQSFPPPAALPTQVGPDGLRFDFNAGVRVALPDGGGPWRIRLSDLNTGNILYETTLQSGRVASAKQYHLRARIQVMASDRVVLAHDYDCRNREVLIQLPVGTLGDSLGWFPYAVKFQHAHGCRLSVTLADWLIPLFRDAYPEITFLTREQVDPRKYYATYNLGLFFDDEARTHQPCDFRLVGLHRTAGYILGVDPAEEPPRIVPEPGGRPVAEPYVCIAVQSTTQAKYWNNPHGWRDVIQFLKEAGYRVVCIDRSAANGHGLIWNHLPNGVQDETGNRPLPERARWLVHADFFVGLSSGLAWLAWAAGIPVVMISGFTHPTNEFATPYRVVNYHTCNSCWNDPRVRFDHKDFLWCPRHKDTPRQFECTRLITAQQVKDTIHRIPGFGETYRSAQQLGRPWECPENGGMTTWGYDRPVGSRLGERGCDGCCG
jgi:autotransporter strand-loop-strand O-heptosyltransferase